MYIKNVLVVCGLSSMLVLSSGLMLECTFSSKTQEDLGAMLYTCEARVVPIGDERYVFNISDNSQHMEGKTHIDVEALEYNEIIGFTPRNVSGFFPNLQIIKANGIKSDSLTREDLTGFDKLRSLRFSDNNLREIDNDLFNDNPKLSTIYFEGNQIRHVASNVFDGLTELSTLNLLNNFCANELVMRNPDLIPDMLFRILIDCPPTFDMIEERILSGTKLELTVQSQVDSATATINAKLEAVIEQLILLEERVEFLETKGTIPTGY